MEGLKQLALFRLLRKGEKGVTTVEYAVMLVIVAIAVMAGAPGISDAVLGVFTRLANALNAAAP